MLVGFPTKLIYCGKENLSKVKFKLYRHLQEFLNVFFFFFSQDLLVWAGATSVMGASMVHIPLFNRLHKGKVPWLLLKSQHKQNDLTEKAFFFFFSAQALLSTLVLFQAMILTEFSYNSWRLFSGHRPFL